MEQERSNYISLQEATKYCDYSQEYLALRIRQGKLKGKKMGRNWVTKEEWLDEYLKRSENYISLQEATKYCDYSQEYLSLRARQGKLKSLKLGRNWVTKKEWLKDYLGGLSGKNNGNKKSDKFVSGQEFFIRVMPKIENPALQKSFVPVFLIISILISFGVFFSFIQFPKIAKENKLASVDIGYVIKYNKDTFLEYGKWISENIKNQTAKFKNYYYAFFPTKKKPIAENQAIVVVPSSQDNETLKQKIQESFSDEVKVELKDNTWGIIKPIFKNPTEQEYLFMMVPVKN